MNPITLTYTEDELSRAARILLKAVENTGRRVVALHAGMGVGKTTLVAAVCDELHTVTGASSPTFALINEYPRNDEYKPVYHFDFYRIDRLEEALDLGVFDYFDSGAICLIEWPERIESLLPGDTLWVKLDRNSDNTRTMSIFADQS